MAFVMPVDMPALPEEWPSNVEALLVSFIWQELVDDLKAGATSWPVDTGTSEASFFTDGSQLLNYVFYAVIIEKRERIVQAYLDSQIRNLYRSALDVLPNIRGASQVVADDPMSAIRNRMVGQRVARFRGRRSARPDVTVDDLRVRSYHEASLAEDARRFRSLDDWREWLRRRGVR